MILHCCGQVTVTPSAAAAFFCGFFCGLFLLGFLRRFLGRGRHRLAAAGWLAGAAAVSAAQAGAAKIKALNNSNIFFMVTLPLWLKNIHGLPGFLTRQV